MLRRFFEISITDESCLRKEIEKNKNGMEFSYIPPEMKPESVQSLHVSTVGDPVG